MLSTFVGKKKVRYIDRNMTGYRPEIKIRYMDANCALYVLQLSSTQKWKNQHLKQCKKYFLINLFWRKKTLFSHLSFDFDILFS